MVVRFFFLFVDSFPRISLENREADNFKSHFYCCFKQLRNRCEQTQTKNCRWTKQWIIHKKNVLTLIRKQQKLNMTSAPVCRVCQRITQLSVWEIIISNTKIEILFVFWFDVKRQRNKKTKKKLKKHYHSTSFLTFSYMFKFFVIACRHGIICFYNTIRENWK